MYQIKRIIIRESDKALSTIDDINKFRTALATLTGSKNEDITFMYEDISNDEKRNN